MLDTELTNWHVLITMNCLPPASHDIIEGPPSWKAAEKTISKFVEFILHCGWKPTLFVTPDCLTKMKRLFLDMADSGSELCLLCHPQLLDYQTFLGYYDVDKQREIIGLARDIWSQTLGAPPKSFRQGFFSANDYTFLALCMEGFEQGSCSLPGRFNNDYFSTWENAPLYPHHTDPLNKNDCGSMEFLEIPVSSDIHSMANYDRGLNFFTPPHLRIENQNVHSNASKIFNSVIEANAELERELTTFVFLTSNAMNWGDNQRKHRERFSTLIENLQRKAAGHERRIAAASPQELHSLADKIWGYSEP